MKTLVTGGSGFIGGHMVDLLLNHGHSVRLFSRTSDAPERLKNRNVELFQGDLEDYPSVSKAMEGIQVFYHIGEMKNTGRKASEKNVRLMEHIIENCRKKKIDRLVFISSISVAGIPSDIPATEDTEPETILEDHYTSYKRTCELLLNDKSSGVEFAIIRPGVVYGTRSRHLGKLITAIEKIGSLGIPFIGNARNLAPFIHVNDLVQAIYLSGTKEEASGQIFNITDGLRHSWFDFFSAIAQSLGRTVRIVPLSPLLLRFPSIIVDFFSSIFNTEFDLTNYTSFFSRDISFENTKAKNILGWEPDYPDFTDGIKEMVESYKGTGAKMRRIQP